MIVFPVRSSQSSFRDSKKGLAKEDNTHYDFAHTIDGKGAYNKGNQMTREQITLEIFEIFQREFEIINPGLDDDLRETFGFDSVDAIELLLEIERLLHLELTHEEKKMAMEIRNIGQIIDYVESMAKKRDL
jgi:acyl carrier protein